MIFKRSIAVLIPIFLVLILIAPTVRATGPAEVVRVFAPTAYGMMVFGGYYGELNIKKLDNTPAAIGYGVDNAYASTHYFENPSYQNYWAPYDNRSNFPPDNATILSVSMVAVIWCQVPRQFRLYMYLFNGTDETISYGNYENAAMAATLYSYNITTVTTWNATMLKADIGDPQHGFLSPDFTLAFYVQLYGGPTNKAVYIDYIGLDYIWTNSTTAGGGGSETDFAVMNLDVSGMMGIVGFIGMIGVPAASVWFFRRDGGSKIYFGVMALVAFTVCFGFFLGSINGG